MENQNQNDNQETDIIVLLEYFKNGIKKIFNLLGKLLKYTFNCILYFLFLIKKYFYIVLGCIIIAATIGYFDLETGGEGYNYEVVVRPNFNSTYSIYQYINTFGQKNSKNKFEQSIQGISISPIKSFKDNIDIYYQTILNNPNLIDLEEKPIDKQDTFFFNQYKKVEKFQQNIKDEEYPYQKIEIKSSSPLSQQLIRANLLKDIENNPYFTNYKNAYLNSINIKVKYYTQNIEKIDTILASIAKKALSPEYQILSIGKDGETKKELAFKDFETQLLEKSTEYANVLANLEIRKASNSNVITIVSISDPIKINSYEKRDMKKYLKYGLISSLFIILVIAILKYIKKYEKKES